MLVTSKGKTRCQAKGGNDVHALKPPPAFDAFNGLPPGGAGEFTLQAFSCAASIGKNALSNRNSL
jgi:hypothetical protein